MGAWFTGLLRALRLRRARCNEHHHLRFVAHMLWAEQRDNNDQRRLDGDGPLALLQVNCGLY